MLTVYSVNVTVVEQNVEPVKQKVSKFMLTSEVKGPRHVKTKDGKILHVDQACCKSCCKFTVSKTKRILMKYSMLKCSMAQPAPFLYVRCAEGAFTVC